MNVPFALYGRGGGERHGLSSFFMLNEKVGEHGRQKAPTLFYNGHFLSKHSRIYFSTRLFMFTIDSFAIA